MRYTCMYSVRSAEIDYARVVVVQQTAGGMTFCKFNAYIYVYNPAIDLDFDVSFAVAFPRPQFVHYTRVRRIRNGGPYTYNSRKKSLVSSRIQFPLLLPVTAIGDERFVFHPRR